jgi:hypothetical protein
MVTRVAYSAGFSNFPSAGGALAPRHQRAAACRLSSSPVSFHATITTVGRYGQGQSSTSARRASYYPPPSPKRDLPLSPSTSHTTKGTQLRLYRLPFQLKLFTLSSLLYSLQLSTLLGLPLLPSQPHSVSTSYHIRLEYTRLVLLPTHLV